MLRSNCSLIILLVYTCSLLTRYLQQSAEMLANYIENNETGNIVKIGSDTWIVTRSGTLIGAFPVDYLAWMAEIEAAEKLISASSGKYGFKAKELLIEGQVDPAARKAMESRGWTIRQGAK